MSSAENENFRKQELVYLRNELNQNLNVTSERTHRLVGLMILIWGGTLTLFSTNTNFMESIFTPFVVTTIFFISIVVLYFLQFRNFENAKSTNKIAAYIAIFYEKRPNSEKDGRIFWELTIFETWNELNKNKLDDKLGKWNNELNKILNKEYLWLSVIAIFTKIAFLYGFLYKYYKICQYNALDYFMIAVCFIYILISFIFLFRIYKFSSLNLKKWFDIKKGYLNDFLEYAIETGHYTEEEAKKNLGEYIYGEITKEKVL